MKIFLKSLLIRKSSIQHRLIISYFLLTGIIVGIVGITLYKGSDKSSLKKADQLTTKTDTTAAYQFKADLPAAADKSQFYVIKASKGKAVVMSDTLEVNATNMMRPKRGN